MATIPTSGATAPILKFSAPANAQSYLTGEDIDVSIDASDEGSVVSVSLYLNDTLISKKTSAPYEWRGSTGETKLKDVTPGEYLIKAIAVDDSGNESNIWTRLAVADPIVHVETVNIAVGKTASQSSNQYETERGEADDVIDGLTQGVNLADSSWNHTTNEQSPWVEVDLGDHYDIYDIDVWNRIGASSRLTNFYVFVSDYPFASNNRSTTLNDKRVYAYHYASQCDRPTKFDIKSTGQYVRVQLVGSNFLNVAEIMVNTLPANTAPVTNVAPKAMISNDRDINENDTITIDATESFDFEGSTLSYQWTMPEGIELMNPTSATPQFIVDSFSYSYCRS